MNERMRQLVALLNEYAEAYYNSAAPKVSDKEYDELFDELLRLEKETGIVLDDSPTRRVGFKPLSEFSEHRHLGRLWSMDKVRTEGELIEWSRRAERLRDEYNQAHPDSPLPKLRRRKACSGRNARQRRYGGGHIAPGNDNKDYTAYNTV